MTDRKQNRVVRPCISTNTDSFGTVVLACAVEFACWCYKNRSHLREFLSTFPSK